MSFIKKIQPPVDGIYDDLRHLHPRTMRETLRVYEKMYAERHSLASSMDTQKVRSPSQ